MKSIWKYPLDIDEREQEIDVPRGANILSFDMQLGVPTVWILIPNTDVKGKEKLHFKTFLTGDKLPEDVGGYTFLGTVLVAKDTFVFHIFYRKESLC